jgi:hypothetical protein
MKEGYAMLPLATQFANATFTYTQIAHQGDLAIFRQTHKASQGERYERLLAGARSSTYPHPCFHCQRLRGNVSKRAR